MGLGGRPGMATIVPAQRKPAPGEPGPRPALRVGSDRHAGGPGPGITLAPGGRERDPRPPLAEHDDPLLMRRAIELARQSVRAGGGPFGCVIARGGRVVAEGSNRVTLDNDPTAHA